MTPRSRLPLAPFLDLLYWMKVQTYFPTSKKLKTEGWKSPKNLLQSLPVVQTIKLIFICVDHRWFWCRMNGLRFKRWWMMRVLCVFVHQRMFRLKTRDCCWNLFGFLLLEVSRNIDGIVSIVIIWSCFCDIGNVLHTQSLTFVIFKNFMQNC